MKALILDGQNGHEVWPKTTAMMKDYLEQTGLFDVSVARTAYVWQGDPYHEDGGETVRRRRELLETFAVPGPPPVLVDTPRPDPHYRPDFSSCQVVVSNFGWRAAPWPEETQKAFETFVRNGGGFVVVHAANNCFPDWIAYNQMCGVGGWAGRDEKSGPYLYVDADGAVVKDPSPGTAGSHGYEMEFPIDLRASHPVTSGMPVQWLHARDELYERLRGPAENLEILATAFSDEVKNACSWAPVRGSGRNEPMVLCRNFGRGRVFHLVLGHFDYSMECVGFLTLFQRGAEWAATGKVTQELPVDFPTAQEVRSRPWKRSESPRNPRSLH